MMIDFISVIIASSIVLYFMLLLLSFTYSCGGWDKSCGLCWVGIVQFPLILIDWFIGKIRKEQSK